MKQKEHVNSTSGEGKPSLQKIHKRRERAQENSEIFLKNLH